MIFRGGVSCDNIMKIKTFSGHDFFEFPAHIEFAGFYGF